MSQAVVEAIRGRFPEAVVSTHSWRGDDTVVVKREHLVDVCAFIMLRIGDCRLEQLLQYRGGTLLAKGQRIDGPLHR